MGQRQQAEARSVVARAIPATKKITLLCIDDREEGLAIRKLFLETYGYDVLTAPNGKLGLEVLNKRSIDGVILDYRMPDMDGGAVATQIRRVNPKIPIVLLSGYPSEIPDRVRHLADAFVLKGRPPGELLSALERSVGRGQRRAKIDPDSTRLARAKWEDACKRVEDERRFRSAEAQESFKVMEKLAFVGRQSATIAHEIRGPLEALANVFYLLERHLSGDATALRYLGMARDQLARMAEITSETLSSVRGNEPVTISLSKVLDDVLRTNASKLQIKNIVVKKQYAAEDEIRGIPSEIRQVFSNLVVNAIEAVRPGGTVEVRIHHSGPWSNSERKGVRVLVADNGPGISPEHRPHVFEPFFTTKGEKGTGVGLWTTRELVHKHGGAIHFRTSVSPQRNGTCFSVVLPTNS